MRGDMQITSSATFSAVLTRSVIAIGNFDGVHLGHRILIGSAAALAADLNAPLGVLTFEPHPRTFFAPNARPFRIASLDAKCGFLANTGLDYAVVEPFTAELAQCSPEDFVRLYLVGRLRVAHIVVGEDYRFGQRRAGDVALLGQLGSKYGFGVTAVAKAAFGDSCVSSSRIRALIEAGEVEEAARLLGRPWQVSGRVRRPVGDITQTVIVEGTGTVRPAPGSYTVLVNDASDLTGVPVSAIADVPTASPDGPLRIAIPDLPLSTARVNIAFQSGPAL